MILINTEDSISNSSASLVSILVVSCDKYADLWVPFFKLFNRFWQNCPFHVYLLANNGSFQDAKVSTLNVGDDVSWSDNLEAALNKIPNEYVLLFLDDLFLYDHVKMDKLASIIQWIANEKPNCVIMDNGLKPDKPYNQIVGIVNKGAIYRTSTVMSVWKKEVLLKLLKRSESAWQFEIDGAFRSDSYDGFYTTIEEIFPIMNCVIKGKWQRSVVDKLVSLGVSVDLNARACMDNVETSIFFLKKQRSKLLQIFPAQYRRQIRNFFV